MRVKEREGGGRGRREREEGGKEGEKEGEGWRDKIRKPHHRFKLITNITAIKNVFYAYGRNNTA